LAEKRAEKAESLLERLTETVETLTNRLEYKPEASEPEKRDQPERKKGKVLSLSDFPSLDPKRQKK